MTSTIGERDGRPAVSHTFRARYSETDAMGIVHHSSYVLWMEVGRTEFMRAHGFTYRQLEEMGVQMPVLELNVRFRRPAYYDDELRITTWV
ncbi:MAG TPA: thioesterase family protein, partial [Chloroflexia bacterium]|nr:thioesterase family protein [Chloroflexia bacterium]